MEIDSLDIDPSEFSRIDQAVDSLCHGTPKGVHSIVLHSTPVRLLKRPLEKLNETPISSSLDLQASPAPKKSLKFSSPFQINTFLSSSRNGSSGIRVPDSSLKYSHGQNPTLDPRSLTHPRWQIPKRIINSYKEKGFLSMYDWQYEALSQEGVYEGKRNLIYSSPTSSGKTFVAELIALRRFVANGLKSIFVFPYVSLTAEKARDLKFLFKSLRIVGFYGSYGPKNFDWDVAVCTIEKAVALINRFFDEQRIHELGCVCIDELHMVGDAQRGYLIELMITKLLFLKSKVQILGFSATIPNTHSLARWLDAAVYVTDFRPIPMTELIKVHEHIYDKNMNILRVFEEKRDEDPDHLLPLCWEVACDQKCVLIFCATKMQTQKTALLIATLLSSPPDPAKESSRQTLLTALSKCPCGLDPILSQTIPSGVGFHHAGLTLEERELIEEGFREGVILILAATCTLSMGVNLPARRVIFRSPFIGRTFMTATEYKQMSGRAGRKGQDILGESVLICTLKDLEKAKHLVNTPLPPIVSCLLHEPHCMIRAMLEAVCTGLVQSELDMQRYMECTLLCVDKSYDNIREELASALAYLKDMELMDENPDNEEKKFTPTKLGVAIISSSIKPDDALTIFNELQKASTHYVLASELHSIYLSIPPQHTIEPNWNEFFKLYEKLGPVHRCVSHVLGVEESFLFRATVQSVKEHPKIDVYKRFYAAMILYDLIKETPMDQVSVMYKIHKGQIQALQQHCSTFASMLAGFCDKLGWKSMSLLFDQLKSRFQHFVEEELLPLTSIPYVKTFRARVLYNGGYQTIQDVAKANPLDIANLLIEKTPFVSKKDAPNSSSLHIAIEHRAAERIVQGAIELVREEAEAMERDLDQRRQLLDMENKSGSLLKVGSISSLASDSPQYTMDSPQRF